MKNTLITISYGEKTQDLVHHFIKCKNILELMISTLLICVLTYVRNSGFLVDKTCFCFFFSMQILYIHYKIFDIEL